MEYIHLNYKEYYMEYLPLLALTTVEAVEHWIATELSLGW